MATATAFPQFEQKVGTKLVNAATDTWKVVLLTAYTYANTHATLADVLAAGTEASGTGYTAGGNTLTSVTYTTSGNVTTLTAANVTGLTVTCRYIVVADTQGGTTATSYPVTYIDLGAATAISGITWNASGIATWQ